MAQVQPVFTGEWNLTGQPAISVPGGVSDDGLPIGVMIVARHNEEATLISLAAQLEGEVRWTDRRPPLA
jgi:Asp-tRNA(Asn)/Glu-tRNA(Gln) amidotransferase A subunit family amidase